MRPISVLAILFFLSGSALASAENPIEQKLNDLDAVDQEILKHDCQPSEPQPDEACKTLREQQRALLEAIAAWAGEPLPDSNAATPNPPGQATQPAAEQLEKNMEQRQRYNDALLETNALRRSQAN